MTRKPYAVAISGNTIKRVGDATSDGDAANNSIRHRKQIAKTKKRSKVSVINHSAWLISNPERKGELIRGLTLIDDSSSRYALNARGDLWIKYRNAILNKAIECGIEGLICKGGIVSVPSKSDPVIARDIGIALLYIETVWQWAERIGTERNFGRRKKMALDCAVAGLELMELLGGRLKLSVCDLSGAVILAEKAKKARQGRALGGGSKPGAGRKKKAPSDTEVYHAYTTAKTGDQNKKAKVLRKEIGRRFGVSPTTVANALARVRNQ